MGNQYQSVLEGLVKSITTRVKKLGRKKSAGDKPYAMIVRTKSVKVEIRSRKARRLIHKNLQQVPIS
ncbi:unnamed protein product [Cuscuta campestris]|uniref:Uncharacterized protein n=1 Tax=Cuscuta campestris TaxID=132261 RepID=A0A484LRW0_9ASTE|nr:unnamed protein product [Cuscuta campestris]